ncbi:alpha-1,2-mannosyltransferase KTR1 [Sugiyamaella lignohabitans]|uniref:Alpha-1,2-mannosyltransferase KTR1 n=1 Tax=Sugiyamaella lignohabitans TaxID=796027 RepID=A0A167DTK3_9ASCO|nr:alpha-1,2-mannosyltransferase KTR1 [Sugiyamaella lignohabitans]ANB13278.1 alpha-1,2-mannosyltransferase KTR1 [Sugiyamaella lignohabitans]
MSRPRKRILGLVALLTAAYLLFSKEFTSGGIGLVTRNSNISHSESPASDHTDSGDVSYPKYTAGETTAQRLDLLKKLQDLEQQELHYQQSEDSRHKFRLQNTFAEQQSSEFAALENATFVTLARNSDLLGLMNTIRSVEDRFNNRYHYDWVFLNNEPFTEEFVKVSSSLVSGQARYGVIGLDHWSYPDWINRTAAAEVRNKMRNAGIIYGDSESYRHMCRYESGFFYHHPLMREYKYYWRVEPDTLLHCDIDYDVFKYMREEKKKYGFTIALREYISTIESLWDVTRQYLSHVPDALNSNSLLEFISDDYGVTYNLCHFWTNFEIADMDFWRAPPYQDYFDFLDKAGGFFYERWGDAPVHSIAASLFLDKKEIHFFDDIGYTHPPFTHCPMNPIERGLTCSCLPTQNFDWQSYSCTRQFYKAQNMPLPDNIPNA